MMERIRNLFGIGRATLIDDSGDMQLVQVTEGAAGEGYKDRVTDKVRRVVEYGFYSVPPLGSEILTACRGGDRTKPMVIGTSHRPSRPRNKKPGDSGLYNGVTGAIIEQTADGTLIDCGGLPAIVRNFSSLTVMGDIHVTGDVISRSTGAAISLNGLRDAYDAHKHGVSAVGSPTGVTDHPA